MSPPTTPQEPVLEIAGVSHEFRVQAAGRNRMLRAVDDVTLAVGREETVGLVGESGCGKTTLALIAAGLLAPTEGRLIFKGADVTKPHDRRRRGARGQIQMVFQDPYDSLNPRQKVERIIAEPLRASGVPRAEALERADALLRTVGFGDDIIGRRPAGLSGGQRQRIGIGRAIATNPSLVILDEPTSALDVSVQAQILQLLRDLQTDRGLSYLFISHNLGVVRYLSHRVAVMYLGSLTELASSDELFARPLHPYTVALLSAIPSPEPSKQGHQQRIRLQGDLPSPMEHVRGCPFSTRCPLADKRCHEERPRLAELTPGHFVACHRPGELSWPRTDESAALSTQLAGVGPLSPPAGDLGGHRPARAVPGS